MPKLTVEEVIYQRNVRDWIQYGGTKPSAALAFFGLDAQYMFHGGVDLPETGDISPLYVHDPRRAGRFRLIGRSRQAPDLPTSTITFLEKHGAVPKQIRRIGCLTAYQTIGLCTDLSDFQNGVTDYWMIYSNGIVTDKNLGDRSVMGDSDEAIMDEVSVTWSDIYPVGALAFGSQAGTQGDREFLDVAYAVEGGCQDCDTPDAYTKWIYAITKSSGSGSPGLPAELVYSVDSGATWTDAAITGIGATEDPIQVEIIGDKIVVLSRTAGSATSGGYYYATLNQYTGAPGSWTKVISGFVANRQPNELWVHDTRNIFFAADGGYIYKSTDITTGVSVLSAGVATTNNLLRIKGYGETIVAAGASSTVIKSTNLGRTWSTVTVGPSPTVALDIIALDVGSEGTIWVGTGNSGRVFYTENGGESTWTQKLFGLQGVGNVDDILIATDEVIYFTHRDNTPTARLFASVNGGVDFSYAGSRILQWPTFNKAGRLAVPQGPDAATIANNIAVAGLAGDGTDGTLLLGIANFL